MRKRTLAVCMLIICMLSFSGCEAMEVLEDILSVNEAEIRGDGGPKVTITKPSEAPQTPTPEEPTPEPAASTPEPAKEPQNVVRCISPVNVRAGSNKDAQIIGALQSGQEVEKLGQEGGWVKISYEGQEGWVYEKYVMDQN